MKLNLKLLFCQFILLISVCNAQPTNLVLNSSFEDMVWCSTSWMNMDQTEFWFQPTNGTSDYFRDCSITCGVPENYFGTQQARTGISYSGSIMTALNPISGAHGTGYREYVAIELSEPLVIGTQYYASFWVSLSDSSSCSIDQMAMGFSVGYNYEWYFNHSTNIDDPVVSLKVINPAGQFLDQLNKWMEVSGSFIADYAYTHLYIGNFSDTANTPLEPTGYRPYGDHWESLVYYYFDDVCVSTDSAFCMDNVASVKETNTENIRLYPNPVVDKLQVESPNQISRLTVVNSLGQVVIDLYDLATDPTIDLSELPSGYFVVNVESDDAVFRRMVFKE